MHMYWIFSYIHSYINFAYLARRSTHSIYLRKINSQQKHNLRLKYNKNIFYYSKELFEYCEIWFHASNRKKELPWRRLLKNLSSLLFCIKHTLQGDCRKPQIKLRKCRFRISFKILLIFSFLISLLFGPFLFQYIFFICYSRIAVTGILKVNTCLLYFKKLIRGFLRNIEKNVKKSEI